ncbi:MAG TPA: hypothetical protein DCR97_05315 [Deltaproteobacteria bacterium]|nr:hypothetical protein [Deltaproteobacteria bacterium]
MACPPTGDHGQRTVLTCRRLISAVMVKPLMSTALFALMLLIHSVGNEGGNFTSRTTQAQEEKKIRGFSLHLELERVHSNQNDTDR